MKKDKEKIIALKSMEGTKSKKKQRLEYSRGIFVSTIQQQTISSFKVKPPHLPYLASLNPMLPVSPTPWPPLLYLVFVTTTTSNNDSNVFSQVKKSKFYFCEQYFWPCVVLHTLLYITIYVPLHMLFNFTRSIWLYLHFITLHTESNIL